MLARSPCTLTGSLTHSLTHSTNPLSHSATHWLTHALTSIHNEQCRFCLRPAYLKKLGRGVRERGRGRKEEKGRSRREERREGDKGRSCRLCLTACASVLACGPLGHLAPQISTWVIRLFDSGGTVTKLILPGATLSCCRRC